MNKPPTHLRLVSSSRPRRRRPDSALAKLDAVIDILNGAGRTSVPVHVTATQAAEIRRLKHLDDGPLKYRSHPIVETTETPGEAPCHS